MRPFFAALMTAALLAAAPPAHAGETAEGTGWSVALPSGFQKQFDSCSGEGG